VTAWLKTGLIRTMSCILIRLPGRWQGY